MKKRKKVKKVKKMKNGKPPGHELVRAGGPPAPPRLDNEFEGLTDDGKVKLAVERIGDDWGSAARSIANIGHVILDAAYARDAGAALADGQNRNKLFRRIAGELGTLRGGPSRKTLSNARRVAAATVELARSHYWMPLDFTHKAVLVQLHDTATMEDGARRAIQFGWNVDQTQRWVDFQREAAGRGRTPRGLRLASTRSALARLALLREDASIARIAGELDRLPSVVRTKTRAEVKAAVSALMRLLKRM